MKDHTGREEGDLSFLLRVLHPVKDFLDISLLHGEVVTVSDGTLQKDTDGVGKLRYDK